MDGPPKQGDILLAGVSRLVGPDRFTPPAWRHLDAVDITVEAGGDQPELRLTAGRALVMVTSHDCHFDKDWNRRRRELIRQGVDEEEAGRRADEDPTLDRTFTASPLVDVGDIGRDRAALMGGKVIGYLPVPASPDRLVPEAVVDLTYRVTLDRLDVRPVASVTDETRATLRYALARLDSFRATSVGFELEAVLGRRIETHECPSRQPLAVRLHLDDGSFVELLQHPAEPGPGPSRSSWSDVVGPA